MEQSRVQSRSAGFTLLECLCAIALILVLAGLLLGPVGRVMRRARAMKWGEDASVLLHATVQRLQARFQGQHDFPPVTLEFLEANGLLEPSQLRFLKDLRVVFVPFAGADPEEKVVIQVTLEPGFLVEAGHLTATKGEITKPPE